MRYLSSGKKVSLRDKTVLLRVDFNVVIRKGKIAESFRIDSAIPTINYLLKGGVKRVVLISHLGRPHFVGYSAEVASATKAGKTSRGESNKKDDRLSLKPVASYLSKKLKKRITFLDDINPELVKNSPSKLIMLENLRFWQGEDKNDKKFAQELANLGDVYVNEAFSVSHRASASVVSIPKILPCYAGLLFEQEYKNLSRLFNPKKPFAVIFGGAKICDKLPLINKFASLADYILIGGGIANTFSSAMGFDIGKSLCDKKEINTAKKLLAKGKIILPIDFKSAKSLTAKRAANIGLDLIGKNEMFLDIGQDTAEIFGEIIKEAKTILWNGPLGYFENPVFRISSKKIAEAICKSKAYSIAGGGETVALINILNKQKCFNWVSTAGGAMLDFLAKGTLPGIRALEKSRI